MNIILNFIFNTKNYFRKIFNTSNTYKITNFQLIFSILFHYISTIYIVFTVYEQHLIYVILNFFLDNSIKFANTSCINNLHLLFLF